MKKLLLVLGLVATASLGFAQSPHGGKEAATKAPYPLNFAKHILKSTFVVSNFSGAAVPGDGTPVPIDAAQTVICPCTAGTCLFQEDAWVQFCTNFGPADSPARIEFVVDGSVVEPFYAGELPTGFFCGQLSTSSGVIVPFGAHTVQTFVTTQGGGTSNSVAYYNFNYKVYKP